jgi:hypothetical protein
VNARVLAALAVCAAAIMPYLATVNGYFIRDDFGTVQLLEQKPAWYFPRWFVSSWMDYIWGFTADEVRPFTAVSYQLSALGGIGSPTLHHVFNVVIHAINGLLVVAIARMAAGLGLAAATFAGLVFVLLPVQTESVAWITGRVDSLPALFYFATFLAYAQWRVNGSTSRALYLWSIVLFFAALFSKQNTITMVATLIAYDVIARGDRVRLSWSFVRPYVPFALMTVGYLWLRYALFGEAVRERALSGELLRGFVELVGRHLTHMITGFPDGPRFIVWLVLLGLTLFWWRQRRIAASPARAIVYFGPVWWLIGVAPVLMAGYSSPRHVYVASLGYAVVLGIVYDGLASYRWLAPSAKGASHLAYGRATAAALVLLLYCFPLYTSIREWKVMGDVSLKATRDVRATALSMPEGGLLMVGAPVRSWEWAIPFAVRPPLTRTDLTTRVFIVSPRALTCCRPQWYEDTRRALMAWSAGGARESMVAVRWDPETGALSRATERDNPALPVLARALLDIRRPDDLDSNMWRMLDELTVSVK